MFMNESTHNQIGDRDPVLAGLNHADKDVRQQTALGLGQRPRPELAADIARALWREPDFFVRETLTWVLIQTPALAIDAAQRILRDADSDTRLQALHVLSKVADPATVDTVTHYIDDSEPAVADKARYALARIGDPRVIPQLVDRLGDADLATRDAMTKTLIEFGEAAVPALVRVLDAPEPTARAHAAEVLCFIGSPASMDALPALVECLRDENPEVRLGVAMALRELRDHPSANQALRTASHGHTDPRVRSIARASV